MNYLIIFFFISLGACQTKDNSHLKKELQTKAEDQPDPDQEAYFKKISIENIQKKLSPSDKNITLHLKILR